MRQLRVLGSRTPALPVIVIVGLLLLAPTFLVSPNAKAASQQPIQTPSAPAGQATDSGPLSGFRDVGPADPGMPVVVSVDIPLRNLPLLTSYVTQSSDPSSPHYRQFLDRSQVSQLFLPTQGQYDSVLNYLTASGFTVELSALNSMLVVRGTVALVNQYLGQGVRLYSNGTYSYYATTGTGSLVGAYSYASNSTGLLMKPDLTKAMAAGSGAIPSQNVTFTEGGQAATLLRTVYNATGLIGAGNDGRGYTVGLLDFYGNSLVSSDLATFDRTFGIPAPPSFTVSPIGPYNPNLGNALGWDAEVDLDVQVSHAMAPGANIILYAGNGELPLSSAIAAVIQDGRANVLSQSFGLPEWYYYEIGTQSYLFNLVFADDYYMLGSAMGMTFTSSSGDAGGSGYSAGPEGGAEYPSTSPYVTSLGGAATYISKTSEGGVSFNQTAWSNIGYVPYQSNLGGGGGGVSITEPTPWYQSSLEVPASFPGGRMTPDLSLDASGQPGVLVVYQGTPVAFGGTSEASPLFAGLLTLLMRADNGPLGLVNPALYRLADNPQTYKQAYYPITFGYIIPWVASAGYNLATGWGAPNIGEMARLLGSAAPSSQSLSVSVDISNGPKGYNFTDFYPGNNIEVAATILTPSGLPVTSGSFTASIQTLGGKTAPVALAYVPARQAWQANITVEADQAGIAYVNVAGTSSAGQGGSGFASTFVGFLATYVQPTAISPWTFDKGLEVSILITDLFGNIPSLGPAPIAFDTYSILANQYAKEGSSTLNYSNISGYYIGYLEANFVDGVSALRTGGPVVGYLPFVSGISLLGTEIYPQVVAEPGTVAPGQSLTIVASLTAPSNIYLMQSYATGQTIGASVAEGANVTATLVSPSGSRLKTVSLADIPCTQALRVCGSGLSLINGYLPIPANASPGLYTILLNAAYNDETTGLNLGGSYFGQVYVAEAASVPSITVSPATLFEGQNATISASIMDPSGNEVTNGMYTALVYPQNSESQYSAVMHATYQSFGLTQLTYDPSVQMWTANVTMPSPRDGSLVASTNGNAEYYGGPYEAYVSGISASGVPTDSSLSAQQAFSIQPYVFTANQVLDGAGLTSRLALSNVTVKAGSAPLSLQDDYFLNDNTVTGAVTISSSTISGTLSLQNGQVTLVGVTGGDIVASNAYVVLQHSSVSSLTFGQGATGSIDSSSSARRLDPALPVLTITSPVSTGNYTGTLNATAAIQGGDVRSVSFYVDGKLFFQEESPGSGVTHLVDTTALADGQHNLTVEAVQSDLLASTASVSFVTDNQLSAVTTKLAAAQSSLASDNTTIRTLSANLQGANANISSLQRSLESSDGTITYLTYLSVLALAVAVIGVVMAAYGLRGGRSSPKQ